VGASLLAIRWVSPRRCQLNRRNREQARSHIGFGDLRIWYTTDSLWERV